MNEGAAKALRREARKSGQVTGAGRGYVIPGKETKALWSSLDHKQRGEWRSKLPGTRAARRKAVRDAYGSEVWGKIAKELRRAEHRRTSGAL